MTLDWQVELTMVGRALIAAVIGAAVGFEREWHGREAGIRTYGAVSLGACAFALISSHIPGADPSRVAANVVTGVGFLGAGIILRDHGRTTGLTTAATIWATAAVGTAIGFGMYPLGILTGAITFSLLAVHDLPGWNRLKRTGLEHPDGNRPSAGPKE